MSPLVARPCNVKDETVFHQAHAQIIGATFSPIRIEIVFFEQIKDRDLPLLLLVPGGGRERFIVKLDGLQALELAVFVGHGLWFRVASSTL